jgi:hypothetical protein
MTIEKLIAEGRRLQRNCNFLKPTGVGEPVAMWFEPDPDDESITDWHRWMTVSSDAIPQDAPQRAFYFSLYTSGGQRGLLDFVDGWPPRDGIRLYAHPAEVLPPIDAVFALGSDEVGAWLAANNWSRNERYNSNFGNDEIARQYEQLWFSEHPIFKNDPEIYAVTGGWHLPGQDDDWHDLVPAQLLVTTIRDSEPWVEAFLLPHGDFKVCQRIT